MPSHSVPQHNPDPSVRHNADTRRIPRNVIILGMVSLLTDAASEMMYPLIPVFVAALGSGAVALGVIEGVAETTAAILKLASGVVSDKLRKRKLLVSVGYAISSLIRPFTGLVGNAWQIVLVRMLDRVGKGIRTAPRDALIASSVDESMRGKAYGFHRAMDHTGAVIGPILAIVSLTTLILGFGMNDILSALRWTFILSIVPGLLAFVIVTLFAEEKVDAGRPGNPFHFSLRKFNKNYLFYLFVVVVFTLGNSSDAFLLYRAGEMIQKSGTLHSLFFEAPVLGELFARFGDTETQKTIANVLFLPLVWSFFHIIKAAFSTPLGALSDKVGRKRSINVGWGIYAFVYLAFAFVDSVPESYQIIVMVVLFAIYALHYAFCEGAEKAFVADLVREEKRGSAFGMYHFAVGLGALPASVLFGLLYTSLGGTIAFTVGAGLALLAMVLLAVGVHEPKNSQ